jgi:hypothetical protein
VLQLIKSYINDFTTNHNVDDTTEHRINATIPSHTAVKAASSRLSIATVACSPRRYWLPIKNHRAKRPT